MSGMATTVACVWADALLQPGGSGSAAYSAAVRMPSGWRGLSAAAGLVSANQMYALAARRHMERYGTTGDQLGAIAVAQRSWAALNPFAQLRAPITIDDYRASRLIAEPFHLLDCCLVSDGGIAVIVTTADRAGGLRQPPVWVRGWAQSHPGHSRRRSDHFGLVTGVATAGPAALRMAGVELADIDVVGCTTATPTPSWSVSKTTDSARRATGAPSPRPASSVRTGSSRSIPAAVSSQAFASRVFLRPPGDSASLTVGLPAAVTGCRTPSGLSRSACVRYGRGGCPLTPGTVVRSRPAVTAWPAPAAFQRPAPVLPPAASHRRE
jgi:hypothetical protein